MRENKPITPKQVREKKPIAPKQVREKIFLGYWSKQSSVASLPRKSRVGFGGSLSSLARELWCRQNKVRVFRECIEIVEIRMDLYWGFGCLIGRTQKLKMVKNC